MESTETQVFPYYENKETFHGSRSMTEIFIYRSIMVIIWIFKFILPMLQHMKRWIMDVEENLEFPPMFLVQYLDHVHMKSINTI